MKKLLAILCSACIVLSVSACESSDTSNSASAGSSASPTSNAASTNVSKNVYTDSTMDVSFEGLSNQAGLDGEMFIGLTVKNKSSKSITVTLTDVYIDDTMMPTGSGVPLTILPGKSGTGAFFGKNSTKPDNVKKIGFKVYLLNESASHLETTKQVEVKLK